MSSGAIRYDQIQEQRFKKEVERINDILVKQFGWSDNPVYIDLPSLDKTALIEAFSEGWELSYESCDYDGNVTYRFSPKY